MPALRKRRIFLLPALNGFEWGGVGGGCGGGHRLAFRPGVYDLSNGFEPKGNFSKGKWGGGEKFM